VWQREDNFENAKPEFIRTLNLTLIQIKTGTSEGFHGFSGVLSFDLSASANMDTPPGADYIFTEVSNVVIDEGFNTISYLTKSTERGRGIPFQVRGEFSGLMIGEMNAKRSDLDGTSAEKLDNIYKMQANGQHIEAVFLHAHTNTESVPKVLTTSTKTKIARMIKLAGDETLVKYRFRATILAPTGYMVA